MSATKTPPAVHKLVLNGRTFEFTEKVIGGNAKAELKGRPFLHANLADWTSLTAFVAAVGEAPLRQSAVKSVNSIVADGTLDAFKAGPDGKYTLDPAAAVKGILDAVTESIRSGADEIKEKLAELREEQGKLLTKALELAAKGIQLDSPAVNRGLQLQVQVGQLEAKLNAKKRAPKATTPAPAPAK